MARQLRVGIAGGQWVGRQHAPGFSAVKSVRLATVADIDEPTREQSARDFGFAERFPHCEDMLESGCLDAVVIALPTLSSLVTFALNSRGPGSDYDLGVAAPSWGVAPDPDALDTPPLQSPECTHLCLTPNPEAV